MREERFMESLAKARTRGRQSLCRLRGDDMHEPWCKVLATTKRKLTSTPARRHNYTHQTQHTPWLMSASFQVSRVTLCWAPQLSALTGRARDHPNACHRLVFQQPWRRRRVWLALGFMTLTGHFATPCCRGALAHGRQTKTRAGMNATRAWFAGFA